MIEFISIFAHSEKIQYVNTTLNDRNIFGDTYNKSYSKFGHNMFFLFVRKVDTSTQRLNCSSVAHEEL
jgi:hypothetical protein